MGCGINVHVARKPYWPVIMRRIALCVQVATIMIKVGSIEYFNILFDDRQYEELFSNIMPTDPLTFTDTKDYKSRLAESQKKSGLTDAMRVATGNVDSMPLVVACMDFNFIGGSMGFGDG